jgi:predicted permease
MAERGGKFARLARQFWTGLSDNDLIAAHRDLHATIAGILAGILVTSAGVALLAVGKYNSVVRGKVGGGVEAVPFLTLPERLAMALDDKTLMLGGAMIVMALLVVVFWDRLSLDSRDFAVLGPLPVRPATVLLAKTTAMAAAALVAMVALNTLPALLLPIVVLAVAPVDGLYVLRWIGAHLAAGMAGCAFVFLVVSAARGLAGLSRPSSLVRRLLPVVQVVLVLALLCLLLAMPVLAGKTRRLIETGSAWPYFWPPMWFLGLEEVLIGRGEKMFAELARLAGIGIACSIAASAVVQALTLTLRSYRVATVAARASSASGHGLTAVARWLGRRVAVDGRARASFLFTVRTIVRSPLHRLYVAGFLGLGMAIAGAILTVAYMTRSGQSGWSTFTTAALSGQFNLILFLVVGIRTAVTVPADIEAGWVFRFHATASRERHLAGTRAAALLAGVLPILLFLAPIYAWVFGAYTATVHFAFGIVVSLVLLEVLFKGYERLPFVSSFTPGRSLISLRLPLYAAGYVAFVFVTPQIERLLIERAGMFYVWVALFITVVGRFAVSQSARLRGDRLPVFDEEASEVQDLGLTETDRSALRLDLGTPGSTGRRSPGTLGSNRLFAAGDEAPSPRHDAGVPPGLAARVRRGMAAAGHALDQTRLNSIHAVRRLRTNPGFTLFAVLTLALGIGGTTAIYSVIHTTVLKPLDVDGVDRLVNIYHSEPDYAPNPHYCGLSLPDFEDLERTQTVFSAITAFSGVPQVIVASGAAESVVGEMVTGGYFSTLGIRPSMGRLLLPADNRPGAVPVIVISERLWARRFDRRPDVVGQTVKIRERVFEIVGVVPNRFRGVVLPNLSPTEWWVPLRALLEAENVSGDDREYRWLMAKGRLAPGRTVDQAGEETRAIARRLDESRPIGRDVPWRYRDMPDARRSWLVKPATSRLVHESVDPIVRRLIATTMVAVGLVLLVACTNLANLMLARGASRSRELAVRAALGASRWQIIREQLLESAIIAALGGLAALAVTRALMVFVLSTTLRLGPQVRVDTTPVLDLSVVVVAVIATLLSLLVFGLLPALRLTRAGMRLADGSGGSGGGWRGRRLLVASQVAVSVALVGVSALCLRYMTTVAQVDTGIALDRLALIRVNFGSQAWDETRARLALDRIVEAAGRQPGIESVTVSSGLPVGSAGVPRTELATPERPFDRSRRYGRDTYLLSATPSVFKTLGVRIVRGRPFDERDVGGRVPVIVVSELTAVRLFDTKDAVGRQILRHERSAADKDETVTTMTVVGVAADTDSGRIGQRDNGVAYVPFAQAYVSRATIVARTSGNPTDAVTALKTAARHLEPELGIQDEGTGRTLGGVEDLGITITAGVAGLLGLLALALAMAGLYGVLSYSVARRTHEIGVRLALGASVRRIVSLVLVDGVRPVLEGLVVGFALADVAGMAIRPAFTGKLPDVDASLLVLVPLPFLVAAAVACYLPARRAARVDPNITLRQI